MSAILIFVQRTSSTTGLTLAALLCAQVNTEALRREDLSPGPHPTLGTDPGCIAGNSSLLQLKSNLRTANPLKE